jgi:hypothetical protein
MARASATGEVVLPASLHPRTKRPRDLAAIRICYVR